MPASPQSAKRWIMALSFGIIACQTRPSEQPGAVNSEFEVVSSPVEGVVAFETGSAVLPVVADASIASYPIGTRRLGGLSEQGINSGAAPRLKLKRFEDQPLLKFDFSDVPEQATVTRATLEVRVVNGRPLNQISISTLHVDWEEGTGQGGRDSRGHGGACFLGPHGPDSRWRAGLEEGDFNTVVAGNGGNATSHVRAQSLGDDWWAIDVDPYVIHAAREHGQTLVLTDATGIQDGPLTNAFIGSRESGADAPRLKVEWELRPDTTPPEFRGALVVETGPLAGSLIIRLPEAGDNGTEGVATGYRVRVGEMDLPRKDIPRPRRSQRNIVVRNLPPGEPVLVEVIAFDGQGSTAVIRGNGVAGERLPGRLAEPSHRGVRVELPQPEVAERFMVKFADGMTLYDPITGTVLSGQVRSERDAPAPSKVLHAVRGEILGFQALIKLDDDVDSLENIWVSASDLSAVDGSTIPASAFEFHLQHYVKMNDRWIPDILPVLEYGQLFIIPSQPAIENQRVAGIYVDLLVDKSVKAGTYIGAITVRAGDENTVNSLAVVVHDIEMPDKISFIVEMNAYGHSRNLQVFHDTYRLLHKHRLSYNVLGYDQNKARSFTTPVLNLDDSPRLPGRFAQIIDWSVYDRLYGPLFSGTIARDLPRKNEPATHWYLPFNCSWPYPLELVHPHLWEGRVAPSEDGVAFGEWRDKLAAKEPMIEEHFNRNWRDANAAIARLFQEHFAKQGWTSTSMQFFSNHKYYFDKGSLSLWTLDEPQFARDYLAIDEQHSFLMNAAKDGAVSFSARADISRPQFIGDRLDRSLDVLVTTGVALELYPHTIENLVMAQGATLWWYGGGSAADADPVNYIRLFLARWEMGCDGGLPVWNAFGGSNDWSETSPLRIIRYSSTATRPTASFRMKALRRAQQDMELLNLLSAEDAFSRWHVRDLIAKFLEELADGVLAEAQQETIGSPSNTSYSLLRRKIIASLVEMRVSAHRLVR